jgi:uncharacterized membrane protein
MLRLSLQPAFQWPILLGIACLATVLAAVFYRGALAALHHKQWWRLVGLRMLAIGVVLLLIARPVLSHQRRRHEQRVVTVLLDRSASMGIADDPAGGTRLERAKDALVRWLGPLREDFQMELYSFAESTTPIDKTELLLALEPAGEATSLSRALLTAADGAATKRMDAILLISDGVHNSAGDPIATASDIGIPVFTIGSGSALGQRARTRDVAISHLDVPDQMPVDNLARVKGYVEASGFPDRIVTANLKEDRNVVAQQELVLDNLDGAQEVIFEFTPTAEGLHRYTVEVPPIAGEKIPQNNSRSTSSLVIESRIGVLYVEGTLRAEYGAIVGQFLSKDPSVEFCALVQTRPNVFLQRSNIDDLRLESIPSAPEVLDRFDVFIIGDLDSSYLPAPQQELMIERVRDGAGLLMTGGYHSLGPGGYQQTPIEKLLPVSVGDREIGQINGPFLPRLTPAGRAHPIFANIAPFFPSGAGPADTEGLPPLQGAVRVHRIKPAATVLAVHPQESADEGIPMPVLAVQTYGSGRSAVFTGDTTRAWQQSLKSFGRDTPFLRFWGQTVRWLASRSDEVPTGAGIVATTDKFSYEPEASVVVSAVVRGSEGAAIGDAEVKASIEGPDPFNELIDCDPLPGPAGNYRATFQTHTSGRYTINVMAPLADGLVKAQTLRIDVGRPNLEFDQTGLDEKTLADIARVSGGRYAHLDTADRIVERLRSEQQSRLVRYELPLAWPPLMWLVFACLLTTEWVLRRRYHLR